MKAVVAAFNQAKTRGLLRDSVIVKLQSCFFPALTAATFSPRSGCSNDPFSIFGFLAFVLVLLQVGCGWLWLVT